MIKVRLVCIDFDGTIVDSFNVDTVSLIEAFKRYGVKVGIDEVREIYGGKDIDVVRKILLDRGIDLDAEKIVNLKTKIFIDRLDEVMLLPYAKSFLKKLYMRNILLTIVTTSMRKVVEKILEEKGLRKYVNMIIAAEDVEEHKPSPKPILKALKIFGFDKDNAIMIGDSVYDALSALRAGIKFYGILTGVNSREELYRYGALKVYRDLRELYNELFLGDVLE